MLLVSATHDEIAALAYQYYIEEGQPDGRHEIHWQLAYMALLVEPTKPAKTAKATKAALVDAAVTDVSLISGVGPKIKSQLAAEGIHTLAQIAGMSVAELAAFDDKIGFKGRSVRDEWIVQAKELVSGKAPRAKTDKARA